jgi:hypothetical protein
MLEWEDFGAFIKADLYVGFCELFILRAWKQCADISSGLLEAVEQRENLISKA